MGDVVSLVDRPVYLYREVDRVLGLSNGTAKRWINGYERNGRNYAPILRPESLDTEWATWGEFVEVRILAEYRDMKIRTQRLRDAVAALRDLFGLRYPLAYSHPYLEAERNDLGLSGGALGDMDNENVLILRTGAMLLTGRGRQVIDAATLERDTAGRFAAEIVPDERFPDILVNPQRRGGLPTVRGKNILASTVAGMVTAGDPIDDVAQDYDMTVDQVRQAIEYSDAYRVAI